MYKARFLTPYPILRLAIPMAAGIFFAGTWRELCSSDMWMMGILVVLLLMAWLMFSKNFSFRWMYGACTFLLFFLIGCLRMEQRWEQVKPEWSEEKQLYTGIVQEPSVEKKKSYMCRVQVGGKNVLLYLPKDTAAMKLTGGDRLSFYTCIKPPSNFGEPS